MYQNQELKPVTAFPRGSVNRLRTQPPALTIWEGNMAGWAGGRNQLCYPAQHTNKMQTSF